MRRLFVIPLVGVMLAILAVPVLAEGNTGKIEEEAGVSKINVYGTYNPTTAAAEVYSVDITCRNIKKKKTHKRTETWDPTTHESVSTSGGNSWEWKPSSVAGLKSNEIKVTNHSNVPVTCSLEFKPWVDAESVIGSFSDETYIIQTAKNFENDTSQSAIDKLTKSFFLSLSGSIPESSTDGNKIGEISVTISRVE